MPKLPPRAKLSFNTLVIRWMLANHIAETSPVKSEQSGTTSLESQLRELLEDMSGRIFAKDLSIVDHFWTGGSFWLFGSEEGEHDETREELEQHVKTLFSKPYRIRFRFEELSVDRHDGMAWLNAPAILEIHHAESIARLPYRLFALFQLVEGAWHWRVFSGSEPAAPPASA